MIRIQKIFTQLRQGCAMATTSPEQIRERQSTAWALREKLARDIAIAQDWTDLQLRLAAHGYTFRPAGGGLALYRIKGNIRLCKAGAIGPSYRQLALRFGMSFPGHTHAHLNTSSHTQDGAPTVDDEDPDDFVLIEPG